MPYVRNAWYVAAWTHEVVSERPLGVRILNEPIVIWRNAAGVVTAFEDRCIHRLAPLSLGRCEGDRLRCMYHGLLYDRTGRVVDIPGQSRIPSTFRVRTYPLAERHGWVWVWMGEAATADESLIPPAIGLDHPDYVLGHGQLDYAAEAFLVNENLLDLSHISFLHAKSFQASEDVARELPRFTPQERSVLTDRWFHGVPRGQGLKSDELVDQYWRAEFHVPGMLVVVDRAYPVGAADAFGGQASNLDDPPYRISSHMITPMTDRTTRYFFTVGAHRDYGNEAVSARDELVGWAAKGFPEDKKMIEAQQQIIDATPGYHFAPVNNDRAVMLFNQIITRLVRQESSRASGLAYSAGKPVELRHPEVQCE